MVHIKKVLIQGFKSYKDQTWFDDFHEQVNCIVGRNGSGKSNFFFAIRFVLSDMFTNLGKEERQALLHEGSGDTVMSAFVEIVFDNKDGRFPIEKDEVVLRRTIGIKKDEYFLDKKHVTKHDVVNLLESAGFSRSNPYYIVQQGKVNALAMMKDSERLDLLKEVAGARVYDERRDETTKIMKESETKRVQIAEMLAHIEERLTELESEKEELKEYQQLDRSRRALEYVLYDKELAEANEALKEIDNERSKESENANRIYSEVAKVQDQHRNTEREVKSLTAEVLALQKDRTSLEEERQEVIKERARLELEVKDRRGKLERETTSRKTLESELKSAEKSVASTTKDLEKVTPEFEKEAEKERKVNERLQDIDRRVKQLYSKQGRGAQFKNKKDRDAFLKAEIKKLEAQIKSTQEQVAEQRKEIKGGEKVLTENSKEIEESVRRLEEIKASSEQAAKDLGELRAQRDELSNQRKEMWRRDSELDAQVQFFKNELSKGERQLSSTVNKVTSAGLSSVRRIVQENKIPGVYGPLIELLDCPPEYMTAVEITAGNSLFHIVVDTDDTASAILTALNREKAGRVTFIPLNQIKEKKVNMPNEPNECAPLINQLEFKPMFRKAFQLIFGKTLLCISLDVATKYAASHNLNCVTVAGDQVNRKGALTGGYVDARHSRLESMKSVRTMRGKLDEIGGESGKIKKTLNQLDQQISGILGEIQKLETERNESKDTYEQLSLRVKTLNSEVQELQEILNTKRQSLASAELNERQLTEERKALEEELGTELLAKLSDKEQQELVKLNQETEKLKTELIALSQTRTELETKRTQINTVLNENLLKRRQELKEEIEKANIEEQKLELDQSERQLATAQKEAEEISARMKELERNLDDKEKKVRELKEELEQIKNSETVQSKELQKESESMEKLLNRRSLQLQKKDDCEKKIREIGSLPAAEAEEYRKLSVKQLVKQMQGVNGKLKKYSHVNKKALDQYLQFSTQREEFVGRQKDLDAAATAIDTLITTLDQRKDEAMNRTVKGVAFHFKQVFSQLVEGGSGELIMQKAKDGPTQEAAATTGLAGFSGTSIRVKFSKNDEYHLMSQLSGGQKSLVALALIFAIQRCDPAPFYLFDEIDSALDDRYRASVAEMIRAQSSKPSEEGQGKGEVKTQFIITTFRPELVKVANKCYGITFKGKESRISVIDKADALDVIQGVNQEWNREQPEQQQEESESQQV